MQHLSASGREETKAWWEPRFGHLLPGRGKKLRDAGGVSIVTEPTSARDGVMLPLRQLPEIWPCTLKQETPLCRKVWDGTNRAGGYRLHSSGLSLPLSQFKTLATLGKEPSPESPDRLLFLFTQNSVPSWGSLTKAGELSGAWAHRFPFH